MNKKGSAAHQHAGNRSRDGGNSRRYWFEKKQEEDGTVADTSRSKTVCSVLPQLTFSVQATFVKRRRIFSQKGRLKDIHKLLCCLSLYIFLTQCHILEQDVASELSLNFAFGHCRIFRTLSAAISSKRFLFSRFTHFV